MAIIATVNGVQFGISKLGKGYAIVPRFEFAFKRCMNSISAQWKMLGETRCWVFDAKEMEYAQEMARRIFIDAEPVVVAPRELSVKEQFAVAMGLGLIPQEDLND